MIAFRNSLYFDAYNGTGSELFKTDGTVGGTVPASEIVPPGATIEGSLVRSGEGLFFTAWDSVNGNALWKSDGTAVGTVPVKSINHLPNPSISGTGALGDLTAAGGKLFVIGPDGKGTHLWVSDGTTAGTLPLNYSPQGSAMIAIGGRVFFQSYGGVASTDGTASGTYVVGAGLVGAVLPNSIMVLNGVVYFLATGGGSQEGLWRTDGTKSGTRQIAQLRVPLQGYGSLIGAVGGQLYFAASDGTHGMELWKSDGTVAGTTMVTDINPGRADSSPTGFVDFNGTLLFSATDRQGNALWKTDGTAAGTMLLKRFTFFPNGSRPPFAEPPAALVNGATAYFTANDGVHGWQPWKTDGTPGGTVMLKDVNPYGSSAAYGYTAFNGEIYFSADDGIHGQELWATDGTTDGTQLVADLNTTPASSNPGAFADLGGKVVFSAVRGFYVRLPWISDGTAAGTHPLDDSASGALSMATNFTNVNGSVFFSASDGTHNALWKTDGTAAGTVELTTTNPMGGPFGAADLVNVGGELFFVPLGSVGAEWLWKSDGTSAGTVPVANLIGYVQNVSSLEDTLYVLTDGALYRSDGTSRGTINLAPYPSLYNASDLTVVGNALYFLASAGRFGLWKSDGTRPGTVEVAPTSNNIAPTNLTDFNGTLFFFDGPALWKSDGTAAGTVKVSALPTSTPGSVAVAGGRLYFTLSDSSQTGTLWESDGTAAGTHVVRDRSSVPAPINPVNLTAVGSLLLFSADDGVHGQELWQSDGTAAGTFMLQDVNPGAAGSKPGGFTVSGRKVFFSADDGTHGRELWAMNIDPSAVPLNYQYLTILAQHYGQAGNFVTGDLNGDGQVNFADLVLLARYYGQTLPAAIDDPAAVSPDAIGKSLQTATPSVAYQRLMNLSRHREARNATAVPVR